MASLNSQQAGRDAADFDNRRKEDPRWADRFRELAREEVLSETEIARREETAAILADAMIPIERMMQRSREAHRQAVLGKAVLFMGRAA